MKQKVFYVIFVLATIFILIFINRKTNIGQSIPTQENIQQFSAKQQEILTKHSEPVLSSENKPAVAFIKKTNSVKKTAPVENKIITTNISPEKTPAFSGSSTAASGANTSQPVLEKPEVGVTKIGKRPPIHRVEELNSQGIILQ